MRAPDAFLVGGFVGYLDVGESLLGITRRISWTRQLEQTLTLHGLKGKKKKCQLSGDTENSPFYVTVSVEGKPRQPPIFVKIKLEKSCLRYGTYTDDSIFQN
jgi:hypothetical protein